MTTDEQEAESDYIPELSILTADERNVIREAVCICRSRKGHRERCLDYSATVERLIADFVEDRRAAPSSYGRMTYEQIGARANNDPSFRSGLQQAAAVCRAQDSGPVSCPSVMAAVYLDRLANGEMP